MSEPLPIYGEPHIAFAQALVQLARDHGVSHFDGSFRLNYERNDRTRWGDGPVRITWTEGRHGDDNKIALRAESFASVPEIAPSSAHVPSLVYYHEGNFYDAGSRKGKGNEFYARWRHRVEDFPQSREDALTRAGPDTAAWIIKKFGEPQP